MKEQKECTMEMRLDLHTLFSVITSGMFCKKSISDISLQRSLFVAEGTATSAWYPSSLRPLSASVTLLFLRYMTNPSPVHSPRLLVITRQDITSPNLVQHTRIRRETTERTARTLFCNSKVESTYWTHILYNWQSSMDDSKFLR